MNLKQQRFITEFLRYGDKMIAYQTAYENPTSDPEVVISAANRLLRKPEIREAIEAAQNRIRNQVERELVEAKKQELLSIQRKRELLAQIAEGKALIEQHTKGKDCNMCTILQRPNFSQMLKAIDLDSRLAGHYDKNNKGVVRPLQIVKQEEGSTESINPEREGIFYSSIEEEMYQNEAAHAEQAAEIKAEKQQAIDAIESTRDKEPIILSEEEVTELLDSKNYKNELTDKKPPILNN